MRLTYGAIRPGKVMQVLEDGVIKASAPGLFSDQDDPELLPPIYPPFFTPHANAFSSVKVGDEVWILNFAGNSLQLHWFRKDYMSTNSDFKIAEEGENVEILVNKEYEDSTWATIYFSNGDGWVIRKGEDGIINIREDGSVLLKMNEDKRIIDINKDSISLGAEGKAEDSAMLFSKWKEFADTLCDDLDQLAKALTSNPYTSPAGSVLTPLVPTLKQKIAPVESKNVSITSN